jgi:hypothetical protein
MTEKQEVSHVHVIPPPSGFKVLHKHTFTNGKSTLLVDPAGQKPAAINPDLVN